ncbi:methyltransferase domain-containing protein [Bradyrhizobium sp. CNPSo 4010]|uniref:Methyltransferase domain-containing protein n=1 Tax=Bradyrhizobium agreste TaxID=2751811 RepID=A0ABS0PJZ1_9BRAD|nr:methyltransferase domain-containing protein [Bradyrhizobium agreste]MBH5397516.1 methyltransferase domain-containing protein [Bradyrhizobium agreste]
MADDSLKSELRKTWESAAPGWAKWEHVFAESLSSATDELIDMAGIGPGMRILDLACGAGSQSIQTAMRVGPNGKVIACDISATMLENLRRNAARAGLQNIETLECAADELNAQPPFDASICRLGLMLFPSPPKALEAVRRVLKPGARFAALVFATPANNPFMAQPMAILLRNAGKSPPAPGQPGIFALGGDGVLERVMKDGGLADVKIRTVRTRLRLPSASDAVQLMQEAAGAYRAVVADLSETEKSKAWSEVHECLKQFETSGGFETELELFIGSGARLS